MPAPAASRAIFEKLAADFNFDVKIVDKFLSLGLTDLSDFRFFVHSENEIEAAFVTGVEGLTNPRVQVARLRHAWSSCVANDKVDEVKKQQAATKEEDEESPLPAPKLANMKDVFWNRYHLCLTPGEWPSDRLVSKLFKAIDKRQLEVADLWVVKSQLHQKTTSAKRRRLGENLYLQENEDSAEPEVGNDAPSYFNRMRVYFMALAIVGASPLPTAPATPESLGEDSACDAGQHRCGHLLTQAASAEVFSTVAFAATTSSASRASEKRAGRRLRSRHYHQLMSYQLRF